MSTDFIIIKFKSKQGIALELVVDNFLSFDIIEVYENLVIKS